MKRSEYRKLKAKRQHQKRMKITPVKTFNMSHRVIKAKMSSNEHTDKHMIKLAKMTLEK